MITIDNTLAIPGKVLLRQFKIIFEYDTKRNNRRTRTVTIKTTDEEQACFWFYRWLESQNEKHKFKAYSNEKILECAEIGRELVTL